MNFPSHVFREYDIRGLVDKDLNPDFAYVLGRAYATLASSNGAKKIAVGEDCRLSSPAYADALAKGISEGGLDVFRTGVGPTPQLYYAVFNCEFDGGIQVTGSHNPSDMNGFKICLGKNTLSGAEIQDIRTRMEQVVGKPAEKKVGLLSELPLRQPYTKNLIENIRPHLGQRKLKVVVDGGNGVGGLVGPEMLRSLGLEVIELFCEPDGRFPNHHPDPTVVENLEVLRKTVIESKADCGIAWDGDADRIGVVDEKGGVIFGDMLLLIYARALLKEMPSPTVIGDVKCSSLLFDDLNSKGAKAVMWKTGHSLIKAKLRELHAELAGEMSGHIFFKHRYFGYDDAIYASGRLVEILSNTTSTLSMLLSDLPKMYSTPEIRVDCPEELKFPIADKAKDYFKEFKVDLTDGVRISFPHGWGLIRASNTQPVLVMRFEATSEAELQEYKGLVEKRIAELKAKLS